MTIRPTHTCFDDAIDWIEELVTANPHLRHDIAENMVIVHAICLMPDGRPYAHAWVEDLAEKRCMFRAIIDGEPTWLAADIAGYYKEFEVQETTRYTIQQACAENRRTCSYGPWEEKYIALAVQRDPRGNPMHEYFEAHNEKTRRG